MAGACLTQPLGDYMSQHAVHPPPFSSLSPSSQCIMGIVVSPGGWANPVRCRAERKSWGQVGAP